MRPQKKIVPVKVITQLNIDGRLSESAWDSAAVLDDFTEIDPIQGTIPPNRTVVKLLYNNSFLYIAGICLDSEGRRSIRVPDFKRDFYPGDHDVFAVIIDGFRDRRNATVFLTNPYGVQRDVLAFDDRFFDAEWDGLWKVRTQQTDSGWIAEIAIPWKTLRYSPQRSTFQTWGINFCRQRRSTNELYAWSPFPRAYTWARMPYEGLLDSLKVPHAGTNIRIQPYVLTSAEKSHRSDPWEAQIKTGGEIKWAIKSHEVLDLTIHTDFAQADVDQLVNNLQRFSVSFPERRQFFLENASLFNTGLDINPDGIKNSLMTIRPFFSRQIGLDQNGNPVPIQAGARFVQRSENQNLGLMAVRQAASDSLSAVDFFVGRYTHTINKKAQIGTLFTSRIQEDAPGKPVEGYTNWSGSADGFIRFNQKLQWNGMISGTYNAGKPGKGTAAYSQLYYSNDLVTLWWNESYVSSDYDPGIGFTNRSNVISTSPGFYLKIRNKKWLPKSVRSFGPAIVSDIQHTANTGKIEEINAVAYPFWFTYNNGGYTGIYITYQRQDLKNPFQPLNTTIAPGKYHYTRFAISCGTDGSQKWSASTNLETGSYYNGKLQYVNVKTRYSPMPQLAFSSGLELYHLDKIGIQKLTATYYLYNAQARLALNPRIQAIIFYQQNTANSSGGVNARFSWEYKPLSYIFVVFNSRNIVTNNIKDRSDMAILKLNYLKQF